MTTTLGTGARFSPFLVRGFFDTQTCEEIIAEMRSAESGPATIHGFGGTSTSVDERMRKVARGMPSRETVADASERSLAVGSLGELEDQFRHSKLATRDDGAVTPALLGLVCAP